MLCRRSRERLVRVSIFVIYVVTPLFVVLRTYTYAHLLICTRDGK